MRRQGTRSAKASRTKQARGDKAGDSPCQGEGCQLQGLLSCRPHAAEEVVSWRSRAGGILSSPRREDPATGCVRMMLLGCFRWGGTPALTRAGGCRSVRIQSDRSGDMTKEVNAWQKMGRFFGNKGRNPSSGRPLFRRTSREPLCLLAQQSEQQTSDGNPRSPTMPWTANTASP